MGPEDLIQLLENPREALDTELKAWFSPKTDEGKAKIARACLALRNNNGGRLIVGISNDGNAEAPPPGMDVAAEFHADSIQEVVSRFSSDAFAVTTSVIEKNGAKFAVVEVPSGTTTPVVTKSGLSDSKGSPLVQDNVIYVRSINSNGRVSSSPVRREDWPGLIRICFDNREADIGAFVRRHLFSILDQEQLQKIVPSSVTRTVDTFLNYCDGRFQSLWKERSGTLGDYGYRDAACVLSLRVGGAATQEFLTRIFANRPNYNGWPVWVDASGFRSDEGTSVHVFEDGWEAWVASFAPEWSNHFDFWRIEPSGRFFHREALADDINVGARYPAPRTVLDAYYAIARTAESIAVVQSFARSLGVPEESATLHFAFRWSGLKGRHLASWMARQRNFGRRGPAQQDLVKIIIDVPMQTSLSALHTYVREVINTLFMLFGGFVISPHVVEEISSEVFSRRA